MDRVRLINDKERRQLSVKKQMGKGDAGFASHSVEFTGTPVRETLELGQKERFNF